MEAYEKSGYLHDRVRMFHLKDVSLEEVSLHYHDFDKIIVFWSGNVNYMIEGKSYLLQPGDIILVNRNDIHRPTIDFSLPYERSIFYISPDFLEEYKSEEYDPHFCFVRAAEEKSYCIRVPELLHTQLGQTLLRLLESRTKEAYGSRLHTEILFLEFLIFLNRVSRKEEGNKNIRPAAVYNQKVEDLLSYINGHLFEPITIETLSEKFYISKYHMMRLFKNETGYTIHQYITQKRILLAKEKLLNGVPVTRAGLECGFQDYSTFLRAFQNYMKKTPTEFLEKEVFRK